MGAALSESAPVNLLSLSNCKKQSYTMNTLLSKCKIICPFYMFIYFDSSSSLFFTNKLFCIYNLYKRDILFYKETMRN